VGAESLKKIGFLLHVSRQTKTAIPLATLTSAATVNQLAMLLRTGGVAPNDEDRSTIQIRAVTPADEGQVCRLLDEGFRNTLPWQRIFTHPWQPNSLPRGFVVADGATIVGFIGLIGAMRTLNGKSGLVCNLTSWYVRKPYRGWSNALLATATQFDEVTYTSLTPSKTSLRVLEAMGFAVLGRNRYLPPFIHLATARHKPFLTFDPAIIRRLSQQQHILDDHAGCDCTPLLVMDDEEIGLVMAHRRVYRKRIPYSEVIYCSNPALLERHLERIKLALMRHQYTVGLVTMAHRGITLPNIPMYRSAQFTPGELDKLYSELALLPV